MLVVADRGEPLGSQRHEGESRWSGSLHSLSAAPEGSDEKECTDPACGRSSIRWMIAVAAAGICRRYGRRWALADVSFEVPRVRW